MSRTKTTPQALAAERRRLNLSVEQFAAMYGVATGRTIRRFEDGSRPIPQWVDIFIDLCKSPGIEKWLRERGVREWNERLDANETGGED